MTCCLVKKYSVSLKLHTDKHLRSAMSQPSSNVQEKQISLLSDEDCHKIISNNLQSSDFRLLNINVLPFGSGPSGFLGDRYKIETSILQEAPSRHLKLEYFGKVRPSGQDTHVEFVNSTNAFEKESQFFSSLYKDMKKHYEERQHCACNGKCFCVCRCYLALTNLIVLEDLSLQGFKVHASRKLFDYKHCSLVLQALAQFHAASIAVEEKELKLSHNGPRKLIEVYPELFHETIWVYNKEHPGYGLNKSCYTAMIPLVEFLPNYGKNFKHYKFIIEKIPEAMEKVFELVKPSTKFRNVVCHGDLWENNIMFKYDSEGNPSELKFIDFQLLRYGPPAHDIMMFIHLVTSREFREAHLVSLQEIYYKSLTAELTCYGLEVENILTWTEFLESCEEFTTLGLIFTSMYYQFGQVKPEVMAEIMSDAVKMKQVFFNDKTEFLLHEYLTDTYFREKYTEVLEEFIEKCVLNEINS